MALVEVNKTKFYATIGPLDVVINIVDDASNYEFRNRVLAGRVVGQSGHYWDDEKKYFLSTEIGASR